MKKSTTRNALVTSLLSLLLCASMLLGTTFAWFTDSVTSTGNIIKSGILDVEMTWAETNSANEADWKDASTGAIFDYQLWEPGFTQTRYVKIANVGNLDFKYKLTIVPNFTPAAGEANLADVIDAYLVPVGQADTRVEADAVIAAGNGTSLTNLISDPDGAAYGTMLDGTSETFCIILHMQETAGNEYQNLSVGDGFSVHLLATQLASEVDSFGPDYDAEAPYTALPAAGAVEIVEGQTTPYTVNIKAADDLSGNINVKVATATVPADAVAAGATEVTFVIEEGTTSSNITIETDEVAETYEITATGLDENNTTAEVIFELYVGAGKTVTAVYHKDQAIDDNDWNYSDVTGYVTFKTTSFSPFTVVFDTEAEVIPTPPATGDPDVLPEGMPVAIVTDADDCENVVLPWENLGGFYPNDPDHQTLEAAYVFKAPHDGTTVAECAYKNWHCDYYVMLDRDLGENQIFLGGSYGDWGWIGFDNGDITLSANEAIPLLGSVTQNPWTYEMVVDFVSEFTCGVAQSYGSNALEGATFTVMLRLTNPDDASEYYNVNTVTYTF